MCQSNERDRKQTKKVKGKTKSEMFLPFKFCVCFTNAVTVTRTKRFSLLKDSYGHCF